MLRLLGEKIATPLGPLWVICDEQFRLWVVEWGECSERMVQLLDIHYHKKNYERISATNPGGLSDKFRGYFAGSFSVIDTLPTATGRVPFQREAWKTLRIIPYGQVIHYGQLAEQLSHPGTACVVGAADGSNPISIIVSCHRIIDRNGTMTGYAGGVLRKGWLLRHEGYLLLQALNNLYQLVHTFM